MSTLERKHSAATPRWGRRDVFGRILLAPQEAKLLNCLLCRQGEVVSHADLIEWLWGDDPDGGPLDANGVIKTRICWLRYLGWPIDTVWGRGYMICWADQPRPERVRMVAPAGRKVCQSGLVLDALKANAGRWVRADDIALIAYREDANATLCVRACIRALRNLGWKIESRYGVGYCLDPSVTGRAPNPRYSSDSWRYTGRHAA